VFISAIGKPASNADGIMVGDGWWPGFVNAESSKMIAEYIKQYGGTASSVSPDVAEAYSVGQVTEAAIKATGGTDNQKIISYLHSGVTLQTVQGPVKFDSLGENTVVPAFIMQWQDNGTEFNQVLPQSEPGSKPFIATKPNWASS
jgi:ABC-type branched-subunit amino acid transport system substrate-binding protein